MLQFEYAYILVYNNDHTVLECYFVKLVTITACMFTSVSINFLQIDWSLIKELVVHFNKSAMLLLTKRYRDTCYHSRYKVTFENEDDLKNLISNDITINGVQLVIELPLRFYIPSIHQLRSSLQSLKEHTDRKNFR